MNIKPPVIWPFVYTGKEASGNRYWSVEKRPGNLQLGADIAQRLAEALDACLAKLEHCRNGSPTFAVNEKRKARKALAEFDALMGEENG